MADTTLAEREQIGTMHAADLTQVPFVRDFK